MYVMKGRCNTHSRTRYYLDEDSQLHAPENRPRYKLTGSLVDPRAEKNFLPMPGIEPEFRGRPVPTLVNIPTGSHFRSLPTTTS